MSSRSRTWALAAALTLVGCGRPAFDGQLFRNDELAFRVGPVPSEWRPIEASEALLAFRDDPSAATIAVNGRCGRDGDDVPLASLTQHLFIHFTDRRPQTQEALNLDGREALRSRLQADLDGVPRDFVVVVLKKDGCVYDFLYVGVPGGPPAALERFDAFVASFSTVSAGP
jgi:hypothetical protein